MYILYFRHSCGKFCSFYAGAPAEEGELNFQRLFLTLSGRISRQTFWTGFSMLIAAQIIITIIMQIIGLADISTDGSLTMGFWISQVALFLIFLWPMICVSTKRYHDIGKSGWRQLILLIPIVGLAWFIIEVGLLKGTPGRNRFGANPLSKTSLFS